MKNFLKNFLLGVPLAIGCMLTLLSVSSILSGTFEDGGGGLFYGLVGIPLLFATLVAIFKG